MEEEAIKKYNEYFKEKKGSSRGILNTQYFKQYVEDTLRLIIIEKKLNPKNVKFRINLNY